MVGVTMPQNPRGADGEFPERVEKGKSGVGWVGMRCEKACRMPLVRQSRGTPEKTASRGGNHQRKAVLAHVFHKARDESAQGWSSWDGHRWAADEPVVPK